MMVPYRPDFEASFFVFMQAVTITQITPTELENLIERILVKVLKNNKIIVDVGDEKGRTWFNIEELRAYHPDKPAKQTIYQWAAARNIPYHKHGKKLRFLKSEIDAWLKSGKKKTSKGGGVGQFYAILRALGYKGEYWIEDLPEVKRFQRMYCTEVQKQTGLSMREYTGTPRPYDLVVSFYALGEFDDSIKKSYKGILNAAPHGYIAWNPHSGASDDLSLFKHDIKVEPGIEPGVKIITW